MHRDFLVTPQMLRYYFCFLHLSMSSPSSTFYLKTHFCTSRINCKVISQKSYNNSQFHQPLWYTVMVTTSYVDKMQHTIPRTLTLTLPSLSRLKHSLECMWQFVVFMVKTWNQFTKCYTLLAVRNNLHCPSQLTAVHYCVNNMFENPCLKRSFGLVMFWKTNKAPLWNS